MNIPFNKPCLTGVEKEYLLDALEGPKLSGDGTYTKRCHQWFKDNLHFDYPLLTTSGSTALDLSALLAKIQPGDEVIMPSYTFVSTANSFVLRGAKPIFVDIRPDTLNIDETKIEAAISKKTKAIVPVHYAGISCEMDTILELAKHYQLYVIEDAAQAVLSKYKSRFLGGLGDFGCFSFHDTKNYTSAGEGGLLISKSKPHALRAEILREKGTNRHQFLRGECDKYTWQDLGSSFLPADLNAAYLLANLEQAYRINEKRLSLWNQYYQELLVFQESEQLTFLEAPSECEHNAHMFTVRFKDQKTRDLFIEFMRSKQIATPFHYIPLHSSPYGKKISQFRGDDIYTTKESSRLARLPLFYNLKPKEQNYVIEQVHHFFKSHD